MMDDRREDQRLRDLSYKYVHGDLDAGRISILNFYMDGMDQSKFRCPRNISMSKEFQKLVAAAVTHAWRNV